MQQCLPFTVLKLSVVSGCAATIVATVLTVYGIETTALKHLILLLVATVLTVYGIETFNRNRICCNSFFKVATVLTVYGIETIQFGEHFYIYIVLQQCLPFTVLKRTNRV